MRRRDILVLLAAGAGLPRAAWAQTAKTHRIGVLVVGARDPAPFVSTFQDGLRELGYRDGQNIAIVLRSAEGNLARLAPLAVELVGLGIDILVASETPAVEAAKRATTDIPIVMAPAGDPVGSGLIASLSRPGGNITGLSNATAEAAGKSVDLLREAVPSASRFAALCSSTNIFTRSFLEQVQSAGRTLGVEIVPVAIAGNQELDAAFATMAADRFSAVIVQPSLPVERAAALAATHRLPAASATRQFADAGGLLSYNGRQDDSYRRAADFVDRIIKGGKPADLPVMQPTKFELVINLKTAAALGLRMPTTLLARADDLLE